MALPSGIIPIESWMFYVGLGAMIFSGILMIILVFLAMKTPAFTWLKAVIKRSPVFLLAGRDNRGGFKNSTRRASNWAEIKKEGMFFISEGSYILDEKSKLPIYLAHKEIGSTINLTWVQVLEKLRKAYPWIKTEDDYKKIIFNRDYADVLIKLSHGKTMKIADLQQFFPLNIQPTFIKTATEEASRLALKRQDNIKVLAVVGLAALMVCIGAYILLGRVNEAKTTCSCNCQGVPTAGVKEEIKPNMPELEGNTGGLIENVPTT